MRPATAPKATLSIIEKCLENIVSTSKCTKNFIKEVLWLFLSISKVNFLQLSRHTNSCEQRYRINFSKPFDWLTFNTAMVFQHCGKELAIAFDPSFVPKSGKKTAGVGYFWSGCAGAVKRGLEFCGIAAIDIANHTAIHLLAVQTIPREGESQMEFYIRCITDRSAELLQISKVIVVDAYFSKKEFVKAMTQAEFTVVSRLRDDANLRYIIEPKKTGKRGCPVKNGQKVDLSDLSEFTFVADGVYTCVVRAVALGKDVRVVVVWSSQDKYKIYFSTDTKMSAEKILEIYRSRFQIEFIYRDGKQHTSLSNCQARSEQRLHFHLNASLTAVNVAKAEHWYSLPKERRGAFSMAKIKTINHNILLFQLFIDVFAISPNRLKNNRNLKELIYYGTLDA